MILVILSSPEHQRAGMRGGDLQTPLVQVVADKLEEQQEGKQEEEEVEVEDMQEDKQEGWEGPGRAHQGTGTGLGQQPEHLQTQMLLLLQPHLQPPVTLPPLFHLCMCTCVCDFVYVIMRECVLHMKGVG